MKRIKLTLFCILVVVLCMGAVVPVGAGEHPLVEVVFCLDTTGSMSGLIEGAKMKIWGIANKIVTGQPTPDLKIGLVGYRDIGDEYVTWVFPLDDDLDTVYENLMFFTADGGGDSPEHVNKALHDAVYEVEWSRSADLKIIFLVGDAPPHMDYSDGYDWRKICKDAVMRDIIINTIQCGDSPQTNRVWLQIARHAEGRYAAVPQTGGMTVVHTPFDEELAALNSKLEETVVAYGSPEIIAESEKRASKVKRMAAPAAAERAAYKAMDTVLSTFDLVDVVKEGVEELEKLEKQKLPKEMRRMSVKEMYDYLEKKERERGEIKHRITELSRARNEYVISTMKEGSAKDSFDYNVQEIIKTQAASRGIEY